jgi:signal transduction histidine kinase
VAEAGQRRSAMEQAQLAQAQLQTANAQLLALNAELASRGRLHELEVARARRDADLYHDVATRDIPASLRALRAALAARGEQTEARLQREIGRMESVVGALSMLGLHEPPLQRLPIELTLLAGEVASQLRSGGRFAKVRFDFDNNLQARGDRQLVAALLRHLLKRAAAACQREAEPRVHLGSGSLDGRPLFFVRDNGPGMDTALRDRLFRPFERGTAEDDTVDIGIVSARRIAERHGGELFIDTAPGKGTTFYFSLA